MILHIIYSFPFLEFLCQKTVQLHVCLLEIGLVEKQGIHLYLLTVQLIQCYFSGNLFSHLSVLILIVDVIKKGINIQMFHIRLLYLTHFITGMLLLNFQKTYTANILSALNKVTINHFKMLLIDFYSVYRTQSFKFQ